MIVDCLYTPFSNYNKTDYYETSNKPERVKKKILDATSICMFSITVTINLRNWTSFYFSIKQ